MQKSLVYLNPKRTFSLKRKNRTRKFEFPYRFFQFQPWCWCQYRLCSFQSQFQFCFFLVASVCCVGCSLRFLCCDFILIKFGHYKSSLWWFGSAPIIPVSVFILGNRDQFIPSTTVGRESVLRRLCNTGIGYH